MGASIIGNFFCGWLSRLIGYRAAIGAAFFGHFFAMFGAYSVPRDHAVRMGSGISIAMVRTPVGTGWPARNERTSISVASGSCSVIRANRRCLSRDNIQAGSANATRMLFANRSTSFWKAESSRSRCWGLMSSLTPSSEKRCTAISRLPTPEGRRWIAAFRHRHGRGGAVRAARRGPADPAQPRRAVRRHRAGGRCAASP